MLCVCVCEILAMQPSSDGVSQQSLTSAGAASNHSESSVMRAKAIAQAELEALKHKSVMCWNSC